MSKTLDNHQKLKTIFLILVITCLVLLGLEVDSYQKQAEVLENNQKQGYELLNGGNRAPGITCGILTQEKAEELIGVNLERSFVQGPNNLATANSPENKVFWVDNCRYNDPNDSNKYVELYLNSYQTSEEASKQYPKTFGRVNEIVELPSEGLGDKLSYESGAFYLLKDTRIIQVAANQGSASNLDTFSRKVFDELIISMQSL